MHSTVTFRMIEGNLALSITGMPAAFQTQPQVSIPYNPPGKVRLSRLERKKRNGTMPTHIDREFYKRESK